MRIYFLCCLFPVFLVGQNTHYFSKILSNDTVTMLSTCVLPIDSGYLVTGIYNPTPVGEQGPYTSAIFFQKLDSLGNEKSFHVLDSETVEEERQLTTPNRGDLFIKCSDGNYLMGYTSAPSIDTYDRDVNYVKFKQSGEILWKKTIDAPTRQVIQSVIETSDKGFFFAGFNNLPDSSISHFYGIKTDSIGEVEWEVTQPIGNIGSSAFSCIEDTDGGFVLGGFAQHPETGFDIQFLKLDIDGNNVWEKNYDVNGWTDCGAAFGAAPTGYVISTCTFQPLNNEEIKRHYVLKLDDNFDKEWDYLHPSFDKWTALEIDPIVNEDGSFVQAGRFKSINSIPFIRKFSPTGEIEWTWSETYDENYTFLSRDLEKTKDGGYVMAAFQFSGWQRGWLVKIDSLGNTCSYVGCDSTVLAPPIDTSSIDSTNTFIDALSHLSPYFVRISPNPVKDQAMLLYELPSMAPYADFRLFNSQGERVLNQKILTLQNSHSLALGHLTSGVYIWEVSVLGQKIKMGKLVVNE